MGDAVHDATEEPFGLFGIEVAEAQGVGEGDWAGTHGEDVADDAADAGGGAFEWFDGTGVVVGFDFEADCPIVADVNDAGVFFAGFDEDFAVAARGVFFIVGE